MKGWATATVTPLLWMMGNLAGGARIGTWTCEQCLYKCNTEIPKLDDTGRGVALLDELYNGGERVCGFMQLPASLKRLQKISCLPATDRVYQRQQQRVSTGVQPAIARIKNWVEGGCKM